MTVLLVKPIIEAMKKLFIVLVIVSIFTVIGCGSSGGSSNPTSANLAPSITAITPPTGGPGTIVRIQGKNFGNIQGANFVSYAGVTVQPSSWSSTEITVTIPANAPANGSFIVSINGVSSNSSQAFTVSNPVISYISPTTANQGDQVVISGMYFGDTQGSSYVSFNAQQAQILSWNNTAITCLVPTLSGVSNGSVSVIVNVGGNSPSSPVSFNITTPQITNINPVSDNIGALVTISGQGFGQSQGVVNGQLQLGSLQVQPISWGENSISFRVPQVQTAGAHSLLLTVNGKQITNSFTVQAPTTSTYSPNPIGKDQTLIISGNYFGSSSDVVQRSVQIQDHGYAAAVSYSDTQISFVWPVDNVILTQQKTITINIGGLTTTLTVTAE